MRVAASLICVVVVGSACSERPSTADTHVSSTPRPAAAPVEPSADPTRPIDPPASGPGYAWLGSDARSERLSNRFAPPSGFRRIDVADGSFAAWLRELPLRPPKTPVRSFRGDEIRTGDDPSIAAVVDLDIGTRDLQQCADSIIRLDAEWRFARGHGDQIHYAIGHNSTLAFTSWASGKRPRIADDDRVTWVGAAKPDDSHAALRAYLDVVFAWAGTETLADTAPHVDRAQLRAGDFFVFGGHPGHAVLVVDVVADEAGHRRALLGQGYMPAQDYHILAHDNDPWFSLDGDTIDTPFWQPFAWTALRRLP
jgi:hypothetical protein